MLKCYGGRRVRKGARQGTADARQCTTDCMLARYGGVADQVTDLEVQKGILGQKTTAAARSRERRLFPVGDEPTNS
jgi:hypothetical protein